MSLLFIRVWSVNSMHKRSRLTLFRVRFSRAADCHSVLIVAKQVIGLYPAAGRLLPLARVPLTYPLSGHCHHNRLLAPLLQDIVY